PASRLVSIGRSFRARRCAPRCGRTAPRLRSAAALSSAARLRSTMAWPSYAEQGCGDRMQWDNTTLFSDDNPADRAFREEVREWIAANCPKNICDRPLRIDPPELKPWHRKLYERGWIAPHWPKEAGGMGATLTQQIILFEE